MATVKRGNVPATHPTVYVGLALAVVGLILAMYAYTGTRVYEIVFAFVAAGGGLLALVGIFVAAWGRSIMAARASRSRRAAISRDALTLAAPEEAPPTVASPPERKGLFRKKKEDATRPREEGGSLFAFKREQAGAPQTPAAQPAEARSLFAFKRPREPAADPAPAVVATPLEPAADALAVRVTLRCPDCSHTFTTEGVRPFPVTCHACGFAATV